MESNSKNRPTTSIITRNLTDFSDLTGNVYESVAMLTKRANQIASDQKRELHKKIDEFSSTIDTMDEIFENREQIEVVRRYEQMPKPTLTATKEYLDSELYYRNPNKEQPIVDNEESVETPVSE